MPVFAYGSVSAPVEVAIPNSVGSLIGANVASVLGGIQGLAYVAPLAVDAIATDREVKACSLGVMGREVLAQDPGLQHPAGLLISAAIGQAGQDANNGGTVNLGEALP